MGVNFKMKNLYIKTFGCMMNEYDSKKIENLLQPLGYNLNDDIESADLILLNTCSIRHKAEHKVYSLLGTLKKYKMKNSELIIAVGGCVAQQEGKKLLSKTAHLNLVFGPKKVSNLPNMIEAIIKTGKRYVDVGTESDEKSSTDSHIIYNSSGPKAPVSIITGCDNFCTYCIVPHVRGREESRPANDVIDEVKALVDTGVKEITLLGQNVNSYQDGSNGKNGFVDLLRRVGDVDGVKRLRFLTSHPKDLSDELISCFSDMDNLCNQIHLPIQSGSNSILAKMNRKYTREDYLNKVDKLLKVCNNISISTDMIVGFPGETKEDFEDTLDVIRRVEFDQSYSFKYSKRPGTKAATFLDDVPSDEKAARLKELQSLHEGIILRKNKVLEGKMMEVLVEGPSKTNETFLTGRTTCNRIVNFSSENSLVGEIVSVKITRGFMNSLRGELRGIS
ncbi:tRNA (N6-isopentenyl adenosine(37)-C2)-methylthiotransferase MiaB [Thermodesulfobacteriota bacterium]